tara:strand:- start:4555 stop:6105 length:1551 start_codon:yes stop_codon:yes gene_type:complete
VLYFSKLRIISIIIFTLVLSIITLSNFTDLIKFNKKINLGLDLQGGSYLLLELDNDPVIDQKIQNKLIQIKEYFKKNKIKFDKIYSKDKKIFIELKDDYTDLFSNLLEDENNSLNPYYPRFKTFQFNFERDGNKFELSLSRYGLVEIKNSSLDQAIEIVRKRVDEVGTNEPNIVKRGNNRILVELPGLDNPDRIKNLLGKTANLTFQFVTNKNDNSFGVETLISEETGEKLTLSKRVILSGENLIDSSPRMDSLNNETVVTFTLDRVGSKRFAKATKQGVGKRLAIVLDKKIISAPVIRDVIAGGSGQISGNFNFQSATDLALLLRSGALPAPLDIIEERTVGPDLGEDSIKAGIFSLITGFLLVIFFMFYKYKIFGLIANFALIINLILLLSVLTVFQATLTLPGIAGIILTVGMAVDANVLIYERIKEELKKERNLLIAFDGGYSKSKITILDANITTIIAAIILFIFGSGPIKGFSITLSVGIITTLFTVYFVARLLTSLYVKSNKNSEINIG